MSSIKTLIDAYIKRNANQEITGPVLNGVLTAIADALGTPFIGEDGYWYTYDPETGQFVQTDTSAQGESGVVAAYAAVGIGPDPSALPSVDVIYDATLRQLDFTFYDIQGPKGDQGTPGITGASVSVDANVGTPSVDASIVNSILTLAFHNLRGAAAGFGTPTISVGANQGTPSASVTASGPDTAKVFNFAFDGLKGETGPQGPQGPQGNPGSSQDYPFTMANNLTTDDPTVALTAAMGVQLEGEVSQLSQELTMRADSYTDADYIVRAQTGSSSLTDDASGTRLRLVFPVKAGDTIKISSTYPSGYSCGIWDSPAHCVQASGTTGMLQVIVNGYTTNPIEVIANQDGYLGVSFTNGNTAISDTTKQAMLNSLSIFVAGGIQNQLHELDGRLTNAEEDIEVLGDEVLSLYGEKTTTTQTDPVTPTSYVSRNGGLEDTSQPLPVGAQIIGVTLYSTGAGDWGDEVLYIYDENLSLVQSVALGRVGTTNTYFDISAQNIEVKEGYHYAIGPRVAYKYISGLPSGRFKWLPNNRSEAGGDGFLFTFTYKEKDAKVNDLQREVSNNKQQFEQLVGVEDDFVFNLSSYVRQSFAIDNRSIAKSSASGVYTILFPIERYGKYSITAGETSCEYAILASNIVLNGLVSYATVKGTKETAVRSIPSGQTQIIEIDKTSNAKYLAIRADDSTVKAPARIAKINEISYRSIPFIGGEFVEYLEDTNNYIDAIEWRTAGGQYKGCLIPVTPGQRVKISAQVSNLASFVFIQEQEIVNGEDVIFADGYTAKIVVAAGGNSGVVTAPIDAAYLWVLTLFSGQNYKPSSIEFFPAIEAEGGIVYRNITKDAAFRSTGVQARNTDIKPLSFLHISDIHTRAVDYKCFANACALLEHYDNIKFGIVTGDLVYNDFTDPMTYYDEGLAETTKPVLNVIGNHDAGQYNVEKGGLSTVGTDAEVYAKYIEPYISSWGLKTDGSGTPHPTGKSYYFTDFTDEKIRLIVLCEFESDMEIDPNDPTKYLYSREYRSMRQAQVDWFINSLATTPSGYGVVIAWHQPNELKSEDNPFVSDAVVNTTATASIYTSSQNRAWLLRIIDAFQNKTALSFSFEQTGGVVGTINVSCDFTSVVGDFICVLVGHIHNDYIGHFDQYPNITVLAVGADNMTYTGKYCQRALGTPSEDLFNVVNIDQTRRKITVLRVGADASVTGQDRRRLQISY